MRQWGVNRISVCGFVTVSVRLRYGFGTVSVRYRPYFDTASSVFRSVFRPCFGAVSVRLRSVFLISCCLVRCSEFTMPTLMCPFSYLTPPASPSQLSTWLRWFRGQRTERPPRRSYVMAMVQVPRTVSGAVSVRFRVRFRYGFVRGSVLFRSVFLLYFGLGPKYGSPPSGMRIPKKVLRLSAYSFFR